MNKIVSIHAALQDFGAAVTAKMTQLTAGEPEDQLRGPFQNFMAGVADALGRNVVCTGETPLPDRFLFFATVSWANSATPSIEAATAHPTIPSSQ